MDLSLELRDTLTVRDGLPAAADAITERNARASFILDVLSVLISLKILKSRESSVVIALRKLVNFFMRKKVREKCFSHFFLLEEQH